MADPAARPIPVPDEGSAPFWAATAAGRLELARCAACSAVVHPPVPVCPKCHSTEPDYSFQPVASTGTIRAWTTLRQPFLPGFAADLPIVLVDVAVDGLDDVRLIGRLLDGPEAELHLDDAVSLAFEHLEGGFAVPAFTLGGAS